ncbi:MAG TPA: DNA repair protein RadA [Candidatus Babeliales bacterium]|nr:DNA repair protein RadA [Candidatus Babeliales bacterium]
MSKNKSSFVCSECTYTTIKWIGCCPECKQWETLQEVQSGPTNKKLVQSTATTTMRTLNTISTTQQARIYSGIEEWDRVIGGGIMPGSLLVLTGDPGIGKSTLLLQIAHAISKNHTVFYFSTEESLSQVKQRAERLECTSTQLLFSDTPDLNIIISTAQQHAPDVVIIDSIQNCYGDNTQSIPGSVNQLREITFHLMRLAKEHNITVLLSGHITKDGTIAGPKTLEHMVDGVFYLQGEDRWHARILRSVKNRFGTINELGFFQMHAHGLQQIPNINEHLMSELNHAPGSVLVSHTEGSRPLLLELQALTIESKLTMPQRVVSGLDHKQVVLIAAILEKYLHIKLSTHDIFFKVSGGFKIKGSETDLGIALALLSSYFQLPLPEKSIALGEISLTGQINPINQISMHIKEAEKFGVKKLLIAHAQKIESNSSCTTQRFKNVYELLSLFSE